MFLINIYFYQQQEKLGFLAWVVAALRSQGFVCRVNEKMCGQAKILITYYLLLLKQYS